MYRLAKKELLYRVVLKNEKECYFCNPESKVLVKEVGNFYIMKNNFPYDIWDKRKVLKHLLLVSKKHIVNLDELSKNVLNEYVQILQKYSKMGYDIFTRSSNSSTKTQSHFHTHLIRTTGKIVKGINYKAKPYELVVNYI